MNDKTCSVYYAVICCNTPYNSSDYIHPLSTCRRRDPSAMSHQERFVMPTRLIGLDPSVKFRRTNWQSKNKSKPGCSSPGLASSKRLLLLATGYWASTGFPWEADTMALTTPARPSPTPGYAHPNNTRCTRAQRWEKEGAPPCSEPAPQNRVLRKASGTRGSDRMPQLAKWW